MATGRRTNYLTDTLSRMDILYFEGVNLFVANNLCKKEEFTFAINARSTEIGTVETRGGSKRIGNDISATANSGITFFDHRVSGNTGFYRISTVGGIVNPYYLSTANPAIWTKINTALTADLFSFAIAENCLFMINGNSNNCYIPGSTGNTIIDSTSSSGHLYGSPKAKKINYYKEKLYVADYTDSGGTRYPNGVMMSSTVLGVMALVDGDFASGVLTIKITDTKFVRSSDSLDIYRAGVKITTLSVTSKTEDSIVVSSNPGVLASDEVWPANTYTGDRKFRWPNNAASGENCKEYSTFKISGGQSDRIRMLTNVGNVQLIANSRNIAVWDNASLQNLDNGIGCVSDRGYTKADNAVFFLGYKGVYKTTGGVPECISAKVQPLIDGATRAGLEAATMGAKGDSVLCYIGTSTLYNSDGSTNEVLPNVMLEMNTRTLNWFVHVGVTPTQFETYTGGSTPDSLLFSSGVTGCHIFEYLTNDMVDDIAGDEKEILFRVDTAKLPVAPSFDQFGYVHQLLIGMERGAGATCWVSFDDEPFYELEGKVVKGVTTVDIRGKRKEEDSPVRCHRVKISIRNFSKQKCKLAQLAIRFDGTDETESKKK